MQLYSWFVVLSLMSNGFARISYEDLSCPQLLDCNYPKQKIEYTDPRTKCLHRVCTCQGTKNELSTSGSDSERFEGVKRRYTNCTLVEGNIEITFINKNISFTKHIKEVTGYILISNFHAAIIDFSSLRLIRGNSLFQYPKKDCLNSASQNMSSRNYSLIAIDNSYVMSDNGLREIWMPNLSEISKGDVQFLNNKQLCFVNTINWNQIFYDQDSQNAPNFTLSEEYKSCPKCNCNDDTINQCWGSSPDLCQLMIRSGCLDCGKRGCVALNATNQRRCCDDDCAGGCFHQQSTGCFACRKFTENGKCKESCPTGKTPNSPDNTVSFGGFCLKKCPPGVLQYNNFCETFCPNGTFAYGSSVCKECENKVCNNVCYGLGLNYGNLVNDSYIDGKNIKYFNKNCTIIEGSLHFKSSTFNGKCGKRINMCSDCNVPKLNNKVDFEVFENVREITGYLAIENWIFRDICVFKNLRRIQGRKLYYGQHSLFIYASENPRSLCFNSLKSIDNGDVYIEDSSNRLCHANKIDWNFITKNNFIGNSVIEDKANDNCPMCPFNCNSTLGCWGDSNDQCFECKNFTDLTNSSGGWYPRWVNLNGKVYPGNNVSTCVEVCNFSKGVYASSDNFCFPCDEQCKNECYGPGPDQCKECRELLLNSTCVPESECLPEKYYIRNRTCLSCSPQCLNLGCNGPMNEYDPKNGCYSCHRSFDNTSNTTKYRGRNCDTICGQELDCSEGCEEKNGSFKCIAVLSDNLIAIIVPVVLILFLILGCSFAWFWKRHKSTIKQMRETIGANMVGEHSIDGGDIVPLTPSGAAPNQARLRIVKDRELVMGKKLGSGAFGDVHKAIWNPMNIQGEKIKIAVAVKTLKIEDVDSAANNEILDEAYIMASVDCDYLVRLLGIRLTKTVSLITQLMPLGSLLEYVRDVKEQEKIHSRQMLAWFVQIAKGMLYLQEKHLVHRDLAARNVLVRTPNHVKITDFGLAKMLDVKEDSYQAEGGKLPIKWLAIECITERLFSHHSDVWAYGITCWEILTFGGRPYDGFRAIDILSLLEKGERLHQPPTATIDVYMLLIKCWMVDRTCRPSFAELVAEFTRMAMDPTRYLVLKNDPDHCASPNQIDEDKFFQLLMEEEKIDDALIADEPDQYLLHRDLANENRALYANQEAVNRTQNSHPPGNGPERLFSRSTPSANLEPIAPPSTPPSGLRESSVRVPSASEQDDVFADSSHSSKQINGVDLQADVHNDRKDSEDAHRYTEDPTHKRSALRVLGFDGQQRTGEYLIPTIDEVPAYFDPEGDFTSSKTSSLNNDTYVESPPYQGPGPSRSRGLSDPHYTLLAACEEQDEHDYINDQEKPSKTFFANEEYMATGADSGIGEDSQSLLSRGTRAKQEKRSEWEQSVSSDENEHISHKDGAVLFKPESSRAGRNKPKRNPWSVSSDASTSSHNSSNALNNPGYMLLNSSSNSNKPSPNDTKPV